MGIMRIPGRLKLGFLIAALGLPLLPAQIALGGEEQRAPPEARTAGTLSQQVVRAITDIQEMMTPEDPEDEPDLAGAKEALDRLRERRYDRMNDFEKSTLLSFYTNYYFSTENYRGAIDTFEEMLTIEELRADTRLRTLRSLGQLYGSEEEWQSSINNFEMWRELSPEEDDIVFRGLSYAHYQLEEFEQALPYWIDYMNFKLNAGEERDRNDYAYLNGLYFTLEDFVSALELTKTMIMLFDDPTDWRNLNAVYASLDDEDNRIRSLNLAYLKGYLDDEVYFLNLGQSMAAIEIPYSGAKIINDGMDQEFVEQTVDNLEVYTQMFLIASMWDDGMAPARQYAEMSDEGNGYDTLGYLLYVRADYEEAAEAFQAGIDKGGLNDRADTLLFLARSLLELDEFEAALAAARQAADASDEDDRSAANNYIGFINSSRERFNVLEERRQDAIDFYETYPPLN
jgi:hypothetical protein